LYFKSRWGWRGGSISDSTAFGRLPWSVGEEEEEEEEDE
jgi:hypothetical protein